MRLPVNQTLALSAILVLCSCAGRGMEADTALTNPGPGPEADYPLIVGEPFTVDEVTYIPVDTLNYDAVGLATVAHGEGGAVSGAHKTLPLPCYVEVTSLDTGRTALVRLDTRGPMRNDALIALSPAAAMQLDFASGSMSAVRVRRVNPPEVERARLRAGEPASLRMDTPASLLTVLRRKLASPAELVPRTEAPPITQVDPDVLVARPDVEAPTTETLKERAEAPDASEAASQAAPSNGNLYVQIGAFSSEERASKAAGPLAASFSKPGKLWIVKMGPYATQGDVHTGLEKARAAGYSDAMVKRAD